MEMARSYFAERTTDNHQSGTSVGEGRTEKEEDREQHGEEQLRARLMPCSILKVH